MGRSAKRASSIGAMYLSTESIPLFSKEPQPFCSTRVPKDHSPSTFPPVW